MNGNGPIFEYGPAPSCWISDITIDEIKILILNLANLQGEPKVVTQMFRLIVAIWPHY